jgi:hypothetical protein
MSTTLVENLGSLREEARKLSLDSFYGGIVNGKMLQVTIGAEYAQLDKSDVRVMRDNLNEFLNEPVNKWISVKERLPEETKRVLCLTSSGLYSVGYYYKNAWQGDAVYQSFEERGYTITHWQPLPEKPKEFTES